jgi:CheY-like chemotaxis protein
MLARILGEDIVLKTRLATQLRPVMIDPGQWASVLVNLSVNSRHAMPKGGTLYVRTEEVVVGDKRPRGLPLMPAGRYSMLEVADTGVGFSPEIAKRIFEPFFTTKAAGKGTGLGLAVVHGIVQQSGGFIDVSSEPGVGTVFKIYLPALAGEPIAQASSQTPELAGTETVLLVEDEAAVRTAAARSLESRGFDVLSAADAEEALRMLGERAGRVDILVTDVVLPKMDGRSLVAVVGNRYPNVKVLYTSGYASDDVDRYGVSPAEDEFLAKPYTPRGLVRKLRQILDAKRGAPARPTERAS